MCSVTAVFPVSPGMSGPQPHRTPVINMCQWFNAVSVVALNKTEGKHAVPQEEERPEAYSQMALVSVDQNMHGNCVAVSLESGIRVTKAALSLHFPCGNSLQEACFFFPLEL